MISLMQRAPLLSFFALAYLGSWLLWSPWWLSESGLGLLPFELPFSAVAGINQLGLFAGPFAAAFIVTRIIDGREGLRAFRRRIFRWRAGPFWWIMALAIVPSATGLGYALLPGSNTSGFASIATVGILATTYLVYLLGGPLQEEPGWRGFALPRLQQRFHPAIAALVLGLLHCVWHAPLFLTDEWDTARQDPSQYLAYLLLVVSLSVVLSWLWNGSRGSILLAILAHNGVNWALFAVGTLSGRTYSDNWPAALGLAALALVSLLATRGRLGYSPPEQTRVSAHTG